jgi:transposase InsO family protein
MTLLAFLRALLIPKTQLAVENLALRQQIAVLKRSVPRPRIRARDRVHWVLLRRLWGGWRGTVGFVQPATVVAWHREGWRILWRARSKGKPGRPPISIEVRDLIRRLSRENPLWGSPRIQDELKRLGHHAAKSTIEKYMQRPSRPPSPTWRAFLRNHAGGILVCNFFTIPTATFQTLIGFVVMELGRRRIVACDVTRHPTAQWAAGVVRRAFLATGRRAKYLIRDRDGIYGDEFRSVVMGLGLRQLVTAYKTPLMNAYAERVIGTIRRDCLDHMIVLGEGHARRLLEEYVRYYNGERVHQALDGEPPVAETVAQDSDGPVVGLPYLGGLHHGYRRAA